jgi:peroxiredoxin
MSADQKSLAEQLRARFDHARSTRTDAVNAAMDEMIADLEHSGLVAGAVGEGMSAPDFELPSAAGQAVRLADVLERSAAVICFYRGGWCPYCNLQLRAYERRLDEIRDLGGSLLAVSPELPDRTVSTVDKNTLSFDVLSDTGSHVARAYGLTFTVPDDVIAFYRGEKGFDLTEINGDDSLQLPVPATFVVARDGIIKLADVDPDYTRRLEPDDVIAALGELR